MATRNREGVETLCTARVVHRAKQAHAAPACVPRPKCRIALLYRSASRRQVSGRGSQRHEVARGHSLRGAPIDVTAEESEEESTVGVRCPESSQSESAVRTGTSDRPTPTGHWPAGRARGEGARRTGRANPLTHALFPRSVRSFTSTLERRSLSPRGSTLPPLGVFQPPLSRLARIFFLFLLFLFCHLLLFYSRPSFVSCGARSHPPSPQHTAVFGVLSIFSAISFYIRQVLPNEESGSQGCVVLPSAAFLPTKLRPCKDALMPPPSCCRSGSFLPLAFALPLRNSFALEQ